MLFNVNIDYDSKLSKGSHQVLAESHQKNLPTKSTFFSYSWVPNKQGESKQTERLEIFVKFNKLGKGARYFKIFVNIGNE